MKYFILMASLLIAQPSFAEIIFMAKKDIVLAKNTNKTELNQNCSLLHSAQEANQTIYRSAVFELTSAVTKKGLENYLEINDSNKKNLHEQFLTGYCINLLNNLERINLGGLINGDTYFSVNACKEAKSIEEVRSAGLGFVKNENLTVINEAIKISNNTYRDMHFLASENIFNTKGLLHLMIKSKSKPALYTVQCDYRSNNALNSTSVFKTLDETFIKFYLNNDMKYPEIID